MKNSLLDTNYIFKIFLLFLPFTQALTIHVGFPLKISELLLFVLIYISACKDYVDTKRKFFLNKNVIILFFVGWASLSFIINASWGYDYPLKDFPFRINRILDSLLRLIYIYLVISAFLIASSYFSKKKELLNYWVIGAIISAIYAWYLFISSGYNIPYIKLFGMEENPQSINGFIRCGTFKEGNYFGLYLLLSSIIALYLKQIKTAVFLFLTIITTFSTISIISAVIFIIFQIRKVFLKKTVLKYVIISIPIVVVSLILFMRTSFYNDYIIGKLSEPSNKLTINNISKVDRVMTARIAFKQGINNPFFGVGPFNYGLHYDEYNDFEKYVINNSDWSIQFFERKNKRAIANNIYFEVWADYGIIGFVLFISFLTYTLIIAFKNKNDIITGGVIVMLVSFNAFPSFIMLFCWVYLALPYAFYYKNSIMKTYEN